MAYQIGKPYKNFCPNLIIQKRSAKMKLPSETASQDTLIFLHDDAIHFLTMVQTHGEWFYLQSAKKRRSSWENLYRDTPISDCFATTWRTPTSEEDSPSKCGMSTTGWWAWEATIRWRVSRIYLCWHIIETQKVWPHLSTANLLMLRSFNLKISLDRKVSLGSHFVALLAINQTISGTIIRISTIE